MDAYHHAAAVVREKAPDHYIADLFAPENARRHLHALHAFDAEIARIRSAVSEAALGEIRLQWWRDAIANSEGGGNPLAEALLSTIEERNLRREAFDDLLAARIFDLYNDPMPTMADFEGYAGETSSALLQFAAIALNGGADPGTADAAGHGGVALALRNALRDFGQDARRRQLFIPKDRLEAEGVDIEGVFAGAATPELARALAGLCDTARGHLAKAKTALADLPAMLRPAFLPLALVEADLRRLDFARPFAPPSMIPRWRRQLRLWRAARRGIS